MLDLHNILNKVEKPSRYIGGEFNEPKLTDKQCNFCLCFPDVYEVAMSNLGIRIVADAINALPFASCDRCFAPWDDFGALIKQNNIKLFSLGLKKPLDEFDFLGFSLHYEMCYTNVLYMLDLAGIPFLRKDRANKNYPLVVFGGPCTFNPEPLADFADMFFIGDGEENVAKVLSLYQKIPNREDFLRAAAQVEGVYVPKFLDVIYNSDGTINSFSPDKKIKKAMVSDLENAAFPSSIMVANCEAVHDRAVVEVMRGCMRGCRFCQAGYTYRPVRYKSAKTLTQQSKSLIESSGYEEMSLNSLSTGDYPELLDLILYLEKELPDIKLALPSLRIDNFDSELAQKTRKNSLTFAPEAGSQRLRDVINKDITEQEILGGAAQAFSLGLFSIKLYFMIGLPTETTQDLDGIRSLAQKIIELHKQISSKDKHLKLSISTSTFIPKPFTPFQWEEFSAREQVLQKQEYLRKALKIKGVNFSWNDYDLSMLEAILARGDRRISKLLIAAYNNGCKFDAWQERFDIKLWEKAFEDSGIDVNFYLSKKQDGQVLPWDFIDIFVDKEFLLSEKQCAYEQKVSGSCAQNCKVCGIQKVYDCRFKV